MLTRKNLMVTHSVLRLCLESGSILLTSWHTVLTTLQHLCWVCGIVSKSSTDFISNASGRLNLGTITNDGNKLHDATSLSSAHSASSYISSTNTNTNFSSSVTMSSGKVQVIY